MGIRLGLTCPDSYFSPKISLIEQSLLTHCFPLNLCSKHFRHVQFKPAGAQVCGQCCLHTPCHPSDLELKTKLVMCSRCLLLVISPHRLFAAGYATRQLLLGLGAETEPTPASATASSKAAMTLRSFLDRLVLGKLCTDHVALGNSIAPQPRALQRALIREVLPIAAMPAHPGYLQEAVGAPWDTLVPLLQQRGARPLCSGYRYRVHHLMHSAGQVYMQFGDPERWQRHRGGVLGTSSSEESGGPDSVQGDEAAEATWAGSAASSLVCQDPVPVECLQHPELWWTWHQELFSFGSCDVCERGQAGDKVGAHGRAGILQLGVKLSPCNSAEDPPIALQALHQDTTSRCCRAPDSSSFDR